MKCDDARAAYLSGHPEKRHLDHLSSCAACRAVLPQLETSRDSVDDDAVWAEPSADLESRIVTLISGSTREDDTRIRTRRVWLPAAAVLVAALAVASGLVAITRSPGPDWEVALPGTERAPGAVGSVRGWNEQAGTRLVFDIDGLADAPPGSVYEVWFSHEAVHISAGTFNSDGVMEMWTGIRRRDYPRIWITLEPIDTDESPSGITVMDTG